MRWMITILFSLPLFASVLITPQDALKEVLGSEVQVSKKSILLKSSEAKIVENIAKVKLDSKIVRVYTAKKDGVKGVGILLNKTVRTKKAVVLYIVTPNGVLKAAEMVSFKEPMEYLPTDDWMKQFSDINDTATLRLGDGVTAISGATMSARTISEGARLALAIFNEVIKK
ncbi:MAG: FMN-binding protein [Campylobacterota bacterium]|nr:FMN-binding protein [Campylobacterota bacterium]